MLTDFQKETYLGDGVYASYDGFQIWLRTPREEGDHRIALEPEVLARFLEYRDHLVAALKGTLATEEWSC
jgi:hypothetical protein